MRNVIPFPGHSTAFEVDADYIDGPGCACLLCRPHGSLLSFVSRDNLDLTGGPTSHRFNRQRLNHQFTAVRETEAAWVPAPKVEHLQFRCRAAAGPIRKVL